MTESSRARTASSLIRGLQCNDDVAWRRLTDIYGPLVYHWCRRYGLSEPDAADVFQDVFLAVNRYVSRFDPGSTRGTFRGWLWTITRTRIQDHWRRATGRASAVGGTEALLQLANLPERLDESTSDPTQRRELTQLFRRALEMIEAEFKPRTWRAFWMSVMQRGVTNEVASELGMSAAAVRQAKSRVLRRLRRELGDLP